LERKSFLEMLHRGPPFVSQIYPCFREYGKKLQYPLAAMSFDQSECNQVLFIFICVLLQSLISIYQAVAEKSTCFVFGQKISRNIPHFAPIYQPTSRPEEIKVSYRSNIKMKSPLKLFGQLEKKKLHRNAA
jgi:hypothetical protein